MHPFRFFLRKESMRQLFIGLIAFGLSALVSAQVKELRITSDDAVIEKLGVRLSKPASPADVVPAVRQAIALARQTADPRYLGQGQALIGPLWGSPQASAEIATLQATIEQSRHEFAQARKTLQSALAKPAASHAQAWLTLATIERVQANYSAAEVACKSINTPAAQVYAQACLLETQSLLGQWDGARRGLNALLRDNPAPGLQAWLLSLSAENEERAGNITTALKHYALSLSLDNDGYTALAYADALLREKQAKRALDILQNQPSSDSVLIRRAMAYKQLGDTQFQHLAKELDARFAAAAQRPGNNAGHAREQAMYALYVQSNAQQALALSHTNLQLQREPLDWLIAIQSATQLGQSAEKNKLQAAAAKTGLQDVRLK